VDLILPTTASDFNMNYRSLERGTEGSQIIFTVAWRS